MEPLLTVENLKVEYETDESTIHAVNGLSFSLNTGETLGLVGETGAGKTTTALSILKLLPENVGFIKAGDIAFDGIDLMKASEADMKAIRGRDISMIFQDPMTSLNPVWTVGNQIREVLELHQEKIHKKNIDTHVDEILNMVGISPERKNEYPYQFSGGMKQRVVIAIALACRPRLLLADEPTTALDVTIQDQVLTLMDELKKKIQTSMLLVTHDLGVVAQTCDRVAIMYAGEIIEMGTAIHIFEGKFHHPYTTGLFGSIPDLTQNTKRLKPIEGMMPDPSNLPLGCPFHPRCPHVQDRCTKEKPLGGDILGHFIKCHVVNDKRKEVDYDTNITD